jgi:hypothetical protein
MKVDGTAWSGKERSNTARKKDMNVTAIAEREKKPTIHKYLYEP